MSLRIDTTGPLKGYIESLIGGRPENQDSAGSQETPLGTIVVVCDGMGGMKGGKTASTLAVQTIIDDVSVAPAGAFAKEVLGKAIRHAQELLLKRAEEVPDLKGMGTTVTAVLISDKYATVAHIGDSRIYQFRGHKVVFRTWDHSMVFQMVKAGTLTEEQARLSSQSNILLKALGVPGEIEPEIAVLPYLRGDRFVLCSDGFWNPLPENEFIAMVTRKGDLKEMLTEAAEEINNLGRIGGGGHDNLTAAVFDVKTESILKPSMTRKNKLIFCVLALLLTASIALNVYLWLRGPEAGVPVIAPAQTEAKPEVPPVEEEFTEVETEHSIGEAKTKTTGEATATEDKKASEKTKKSK